MPPRPLRQARGRARGEPTLLRRRLAAMDLVLPKPKWNMVAGDKVQVMSGKDKGQQGVVQRVIQAENRLFVKGLNLHTKHVRARGDVGEGGGIKVREAPLHYSNVMLLDPATVGPGWPADKGTPTRFHVGWDQAGAKVRVSKKSGLVIPKPAYKRKTRTVTDGSKDTPIDASRKSTMRGLRALLSPEE